MHSNIMSHRAISVVCKRISFIVLKGLVAQLSFIDVIFYIYQYYFHDIYLIKLDDIVPKLKIVKIGILLQVKREEKNRKS